MTWKSDWKSQPWGTFSHQFAYYDYDRRTFNASSCEILENGLPFTSRIESPGLRPTLSAILPSSTRDIYTPTSIQKSTFRNNKYVRDIKHSIVKLSYGTHKPIIYNIVTWQRLYNFIYVWYLSTSLKSKLEVIERIFRLCVTTKTVFRIQWLIIVFKFKNTDSVSGRNCSGTDSAPAIK